MGVMPAVPERAIKGGQPLLSSSEGGGGKTHKGLTEPKAVAPRWG